MGVLIQILATYAPYIYLVCGLVALYQLYRLTQVRADRRQAVFSLERERAVRSLYSIFTIALILVAVMGVTYFASSTLPKAASRRRARSDRRSAPGILAADRTDKYAAPGHTVGHPYGDDHAGAAPAYYHRRDRSNDRRLDAAATDGYADTASCAGGAHSGRTPL